MQKIILLSFDIPRNKSSLRVKIWRMFNQIGAEQELWSNWILPFSQRNLLDMKNIAKEILNSGGSVRLIVGERVI